jgi:hypothetical protein
MLSFVSQDGDAQPRYRVSLAAKLSTTADDICIKVLEMWTGGAVIEGRQLPRTGKDVLLGRGGLELFGSVGSSHDGGCEIEFEDEIDEAELLLWLRPLPEDDKPLAPPQFRRPGLRSTRPGARDWELIHSWCTLSGSAGVED